MTGTMSLERRAVVGADASLRHAKVLVIGSDGRVLHFIEWGRALSMLNAGNAYTVETVKRRQEDGTLIEATVNSPSISVPLPLIISLYGKKYVPEVAFLSAATEKAGRYAILKRDGRVCTYCEEYGDTIDHVFPKSRGGRSTWQNLVTACAECNVDKGDRTPEEAGLTMLFDPRVMEGGLEDLQAEVWTYLDGAAGVLH